MEIYLNKWKDKVTGTVIFPELHLHKRKSLQLALIGANESLNNAEQDYYNTDQKDYDYLGTLVIDAENGTSKLIHILDTMPGDIENCSQCNNIGCGAC